MHIDKVYICDIYMLKDRIKNKYNTTVNDFKDQLNNNVNKCVFVKQALVYYSIYQGGFIDIETGQFYSLGYPKVKGGLFVDVHKSKIYGKDLMGSNRKHYSKKKILKKYVEYIEGDNNECG